MLREMMHFLSLHIHYGDGAFTEVQCRHHRRFYPLFVFLSRFQTIYHKFDEMGLVTVKRGHFVQFAKFPVDTHLSISPLAHLLQKFLVMSLTAFHHRSQEITFPVLVILHYQRHDLLIGISDHRFARLRRIGCRCTGIKKSQKIIDFSDGSHSRTRIAACGLLLDGNYRTQSRNRFHFRLFQYAHEMLGICGEGIHITSLSLGIDSIECQ